MSETRPVRPGEEIDIIRLGEYLKDRLDTADGEIEVEQFPAGSSNLTYLIRVGNSEYVLRRPPFGNTVKSAHDMRREFDVLSKLSAVYPPAPKPLLLASDASIIGCEFYLMERREGLIIRGKIPATQDETGGNASVNERVPAGMYEASVPATPAGGSASKADAQARALARAKHDLENSDKFRQKVCISFIQNLAHLHSLNPSDAGLEFLGNPIGYNRRQVEGWTKRYLAAKTDEHLDLEKAIVWLNDNIPPESGASLIHNDYKFDNVMLDPNDLTQITAVLDWEMVTVGDPLMDLGTTLGYWMSSDAGDELLDMPFNPRVLMENIFRHELVEMYTESSRRTIPDMLFYYVFGTFKIAVIAQQIYARFVKGFTSDARFAGFDKFVGELGRIAYRAIQTRI